MGTTDQLFELYKMSSVPSVVVSFVTVYLSCLEEKEGAGGRKILESQRAGMYTEGGAGRWIPLPDQSCGKSNFKALS